MRYSQRTAIGILLGGASLVAQTNIPPAEPKASAASQIKESPQEKTSPIEILTDTMGVNFNPYLTPVLQSVRQRWYQFIPESAATKKGKVVLELFILPNGSMTGLRMVESSGDVALDRPAWGSIAGRNPFPPLPAEFKGPYLGLRFVFIYNDSFVSSPLNPQTQPSLAISPPSTQKQPTSGTPELATEALSLYREGHFDEAAQRYQQLLQAQPISPEAYAGLTRVYLKQKKLAEAHETIVKGLSVTDSVLTHVALGEVLFREGKISEAEREWMGVTNSGHADARAHLGLARVSAAATQYRQARKEIDEAHKLDPGDPDVQLYWMRSQDWAIGQNDSRRDCRQATDPASTETDLVLLSGNQTNQVRGYGLAVEVNGQNSKLLLDTGAHGIVIDRKIARRAGLTKISDTTLGGFGDQRKSAGYLATAKSVKIGALEFRDCTVTVIDKGSVVGEDGLVGADVFQDFLIDLDFPNKKLRLGSLPQRTDEGSDQTTLRTVGEADPPRESAASPDLTAQYTNPSTYTNETKRYFPRQFSLNFVPVFRFGHVLLIETEVGDLTEPRLFAIDTGAARNLFSVSTAQEITKIQENSRISLRGLSGSVAKVYDTEKTALHFAHVQQYAEKSTALNLEAMSNEVGTEVSGVLGVLNLRTLDLTIDYRDGFVSFDFKTNP